MSNYTKPALALSIWDKIEFNGLVGTIVELALFGSYSTPEDCERVFLVATFPDAADGRRTQSFTLDKNTILHAKEAQGKRLWKIELP